VFGQHVRFLDAEDPAIRLADFRECCIAQSETWVKSYELRLVGHVPTPVLITLEPGTLALRTSRPRFLFN